jgi:hypothetical protein
MDEKFAEAETTNIVMPPSYGQSESTPSKDSFCSQKRAKDRRDIIAWALMIECDLRDWAERLSVVDYNFLRIVLDDACQRALHHGFSDSPSDPPLLPSQYRPLTSDEPGDDIPF